MWKLVIIVKICTRLFDTSRKRNRVTWLRCIIQIAGSRKSYYFGGPNLFFWTSVYIYLPTCSYTIAVGGAVIRLTAGFVLVCETLTESNGTTSILRKEHSNCGQSISIGPARRVKYRDGDGSGGGWFEVH